ncbi:hypothetical protein [Bernardetia sp. MNP-M8]|uniref:hypothetical protein n=1 Tax=Bernardetia sp. MNP-M8 TaxID=3127470 RepID=UPI0030CF9FFB
MGKAHLELLKSKLETSKWIVLSEYNLDVYSDYWTICRPNGDFQLKLNFTIGGNGKFGDQIGNETLCNALGCSIENYPHIDIYFGKYTKQFQVDITEFIRQLNLLDKQ